MSTPTRIPSEIGRRLREIRDGTGVSARELGRLAGLRATPHVGMIERGEVQQPRLHIARALARALGCPLAWLLDGEGERPAPSTVQASLAAARAAAPRKAP